VLGEYPADSRVFDIAEEADCRSAVHWAIGASAGAALLIAGANYQRIEILRHELQAGGVIVPPLDRGSFVLPSVVGGALLGFALDAMLGGKGRSLFVGALAGGALGAGVGLAHLANAELRRLGPFLKLRRTQWNELGQAPKRAFAGSPCTRPNTKLT
jgi:hypothetical protein